MRIALVISVLLLLCGCTERVVVDLVIRDVTLVDPAQELTIDRQTVAVDNGRIVAVGSAEGFEIRGVREVDGEGKFLMPGLVDAHVHVDHADELNLYPAFGVTGTFVLRGLPKHLQWRTEIQERVRFGPRLYVAGDYMDGYPPYMQPLMSFTDVETARQSVRNQHAAGYDFVKVFTRLTDAQHAAIVDETHDGGRCVVGHANPNTAIDTLAARGQDNIAHGQDLIRWYFESADDPDGVENVVRALAGSETAVTPNLSWTTGLIAQGTDLEKLLERPVARALHPAILQPFRRSNNRYVRNADEWVPEVRDRLLVEHEITRRLQEEGVTLLAGTDASTAGAFPGDALHEELEQLVAAGLSPGQSLATATVNAGKFIARCIDPELRIGRAELGYEADLVLLNANPLDDIRNSREIAGVVLAGQWNSRERLEVRLDSLDAEYVQLRQDVIDLESVLFRGKTEEARAIFDRVRSERPGAILFSQYTPFFVGYGFLYGENGFNEDAERLKSALDLYTMYAETYPEYHSAHYQLGLAQKANGFEEEARTSFERALEIHPYYPDAKKELEALAAL